MKKILFVVIGLLLAVLLLAYFLLPANTKIQFTYTLPVPARMTNRALSEQEKWQQWWKESSEIAYDNTNFTDAAIFANTYRFVVKTGKDSLPGTIRVIETGKAESSIIWSTEGEEKLSFWKRIQNYFTGTAAKDAIMQQANALSAFASSMEAVYGMKITEEQVKDTILLSTRKTFNHTPSVAEVYEMVAALQAFATQQGVTATNHPMLHIDSLMRGEYATMVGLPVNKDFDATLPFMVKRMVPGKILQAEVKGGMERVKTASVEMQHYAEDYQRVAPAIPFELMVTNRMQEKDSSKWVTRIYYPVF